MLIKQFTNLNGPPSYIATVVRLGSEIVSALNKKAWTLTKKPRTTVCFTPAFIKKVMTMAKKLPALIKKVRTLHKIARTLPEKVAALVHFPPALIK